MEDFQIVEIQNENVAYYGAKQTPIPINFFGQQGYLELESLLPINTELQEEFMALCGIPRVGIDITGRELVNETFLDELAVDYDKGCFLGQETAAKVRSRRGANHYPVILKLNGITAKKGEISTADGVAGRITDIIDVEGQKIAIAYLKRQWRVLDAHHEFGQVQKYPYFHFPDTKSKAKYLYLKGVKDFEKGLDSVALATIKRSLDFDPGLLDGYEAIGVMYARKGEHEKTIEWMDKLQKLNPNSVLAHTNKSLAYMKLGKIELAEEEKAQATFKSFAHFGEEAKLKKEIEEKTKKEEQDLLRREQMFLQVLKIDEQDQIALYGLADISFKRRQFDSALEFVERSLRANPKHSQSYLLLGKIQEMKGLRQDAIQTYSNGIKLASAQGELMPANEMQARLNNLRG